jgi:hypothetical protein
LLPGAMPVTGCALLPLPHLQLGHHADLPLCIVEAHSCSGQYDCLELVKLPDRETLASFHVRGGALSLGEPTGPRRPGRTWGEEPEDSIWRYPLAGLGDDRDQLARDIEAWLGFPGQTAGKPRRTPATLAYAVIGGLLDPVAFGSREVDLRQGWLDDVDAFEPRQRVLPLPAMAALVPRAGWEAQREAATRYWGLDREVNAAEPAVVVGVRTTAMRIRTRPMFSLYELYRPGQGVRKMAWRLERELDGAG